MPYSTQFQTPRFSEEEIYNAIKAVKKDKIFNKLKSTSNHLSDDHFNKAYDAALSGDLGNSFDNAIKDYSFLSGIASANYKIGAGISNFWL